MSIFENANRKVEKHNYGMNSKFNKFGSRIIDLPEKQEPVTEDITAKIIQGPDTVKPELSPGEKSYRETRVQNAINYNTKSNIMKNMHSEILNGVLENVIGSIYYDALYLDDDFKEYNSAAITESVHDFLTERGGYKYIQEAYDRTKSPLLKSIMDICEETASAVSQRKIKECNEKANNKQSLDDIKIFDMNNDEKEKLNYEKDTLGIDKISSVIKDKILNVVKDEKKREAEHVELIEEIENQLSEDETVNDEKAVAEALSSIFIQNSNLEEGTLFNSMLRKNYKNVIESGYDSLALSKMDCQSELDELMNNVTLESILTEDEIVDPKGQLITTEVKDVFNDFMDKLERQKDLGNSDADALLEAFACCENKFYEVANSKISKTELKAIRRDFKILQETFNDFLPVEEGKITGAISKGFDKVDSAIIKALYKAIVKMSKDPDVIRRQIDRDKNIIKVCKAELKDRENLDDSKLQKMWKNIKGSYYYAFCSASVNERLQAGDRKGTKKIDEKTMRKLIKYGEIFITLGEKRIKELESGDKSVKESFDDINYDLIYEAVEECGCILDDVVCDDIDIIEESSGNDDKVDEKVYTLYSKTIDNINDAAEIEKLIKQNDEMYKKFKDEEEKRENANALSKFLKTVKNSAILTIPGVGPLLQNNPQHSPNFILRRHIKNNRICDKILKKRLSELKKGKKSVNESFNAAYDIWADNFDPIEEGAVTDHLDKSFEKKTRKKISRYTDISELQDYKAENDALYKRLKNEMNRRDTLTDDRAAKIWDTIKRSAVIMQFDVSATLSTLSGNPKFTPTVWLKRILVKNRIIDKCITERIKELKSDKKAVNESFDIEYDAWADDFDDDSIEIIDDFETVEEKNVITNNKFVDSVKDKFTPPGSKKKKEDEEKNDKKAKPTKEGADCDDAGGCGATKEGAGCDETSTKKVKKIDTTFDMDEKVKVKENYYDFFDIDDEFDLTEETMSAAQTANHVAKNVGTMMLNMIKRKKDINSIHNGLLKMVNRCSSVNEVEYMQKDISSAKATMKKKMENCKTNEERKQIQQHLAWLGSEYSKAISAKKKELKAKEATKNKTVKEACSDILDECMTIIDKKLDLHEASDLNMAREVCVRENSYNCPTIIPIMNKKDIQLEGLDLPYKMKHVLESLTNILTGLSNDDRTEIVSKALQTNKENVTSILESCKTIPSTPVYKINFFNTFNDLLDILTENVNDIAESNKLIDFREYDDEFLDMYEDDYTYKVITESFNDFSIEGGDEFIDMDFVLADTIAKYTLLETMYTLQLENPKYNDIKNMTNKILNR